jgi:F-type H+-transporting ATPase subunit b
MPQFDTAHYQSQIFWLISCFLILYIFVAKFFIPRIAEILKERLEITSGYLKKANSISDEALKINGQINLLKSATNREYQKIINSAESTISDIKNLNSNNLRLEALGIANIVKEKTNSRKLEISAKKAEILNLVKQKVVNKILINS